MGDIYQSGTGGANEPTADEKAALAGTDGTPSDGNRYVTDSDPRLGGSAADVAIFTVDALIVAGVAVGAANTTGDTPIIYGAGELGNRVLVVINSRIQRVGAGFDIEEAVPTSGTFTCAYDLQAGDVIQMIPR